MSQSTDLFPLTLADLQAEVERELKMRERVYPRMVQRGPLTQEKADEYTKRLKAVAFFLGQFSKPQTMDHILRAEADLELVQAPSFGPGSITASANWSKFADAILGGFDNG